MLEFIKKIFVKKTLRRECIFSRSYRDSYKRNWIQQLI